MDRIEAIMESMLDAIVDAPSQNLSFTYQGVPSKEEIYLDSETRSIRRTSNARFTTVSFPGTLHGTWTLGMLLHDLFLHFSAISNP
jgi:hypothetical protein